MNIDRHSLENYETVVSRLNFDELNKEIWLIEEHMRYIKDSGDDSESIEQFAEMVRIAKQERSRRESTKQYF